jgi:hypothetical protein
MHGGDKNAYKTLNGGVGRPRNRWGDNINVDGRMLTGFIWLRIGTNGGLM